MTNVTPNQVDSLIDGMILLSVTSRWHRDSNKTQSLGNKVCRTTSESNFDGSQIPECIS